MDKIMLRNCINNDNLSFYDLLIILDTFHDFSIENNSYGYWEQNNKHRIDTNNIERILESPFRTASL
jgi:hypothetical protein